LDRERWLKNINRADPKKPHTWLEPSQNNIVCSEHFVDGEPTANHPDPELFPGGRVQAPTQSAINRKARQEDRTERLREKMEEQTADSEDSGETIQEHPDISEQPPQASTKQPIFIYFIVHVLLSVIRTLRKQNSDLKAENDQLKFQNAKQKQFIRGQCCGNKKGNFTYKNTVHSDEDTNFFTGIATDSLFKTLHNFIEPFVGRRWYGKKQRVISHSLSHRHRTPKKSGPTRKLKSIDEFYLMLMKLRLSLLYKDLSKRFCVSVTLCSKIFHSWLTATKMVLCPTLLFWPSKSQVNDSKPSRYTCLPDIRAIIDCTEFFIETPKDPTIQNMTWSSYKHHNTVKILLACAPNSAITFVSKAYGGRTTDKDITLHSGFLDKCDPYDMIQADKGFNIADECASRLIQFDVPPGLRGVTQMSQAAVEKTKRIAALRILVEQVIGRLKNFRILSGQMNISLLPHFDKIVNVCAALSNLKAPIYKD